MQVSRLRKSAVYLAFPLVTGCGSTLGPQILSTDLIQGQFKPKPGDRQIDESVSCDHANSEFYGDLPKSICRVNALRIRYVQAVVEDARLQNLLGAGLIALSAGGIYKGLTSSGDGTNKLVAKLGLTAAAGYMYGENFISQPRQRLYLAGSDALGCAVLASTPYLFKTNEVGTPMDSPGSATLLGSIADIAQKQKELQNSTINLSQKTTPAKFQQPSCPRAVSITVPGTNPAHAKDLQAKADFVAQEKKRQCEAGQTAQLKAQIVDIDRLKGFLIGSANSAVRSAQNSINNARGLLARVDAAAARLDARAGEIQSQVAVEVMKTQPNLAAILQSGDGLRLNATRYVNTALPKESPTAPANSGARKESQVTDQEMEEYLRTSRKELDDLQQALADLQTSQARLDGWIERTNSLIQEVGTISACRFDGRAAGTLDLIPDVSEVVFQANSSFTWFVRGVVGTPKATEIGTSGTGVIASVVGQSVTLTATKELAEGQVSTWMISDASTATWREIRVSGSSGGTQQTSGTTKQPGQGNVGGGFKPAPDKALIAKVCKSVNESSGDRCINSPQVKDAIEKCRAKLTQQSGTDPSDTTVYNALLDGGTCK